MVSFNQIGSINGIENGPNVLHNPTSLQFGPDGRLYVAEQNGTLNAFTVTSQAGQYIATAHEELQLASGDGIVNSIQNHNDDGLPNSLRDRQVTGLTVTGTAENPVLYISSSDPRIATNNDSNLDTNSGVVTRVTWTGTEWEAVDILRGLPRSEENHSINGMVLSADGTKLYLTVGGNTNNGAPSQFFAYTGEYVLSGTVLEVDLVDLNSRPILTDPVGGQNGTSRQYIYDLPTLDDPTVANDGIREGSQGLDVAGPWGGNDGFNMAILPADAPLRIYADGLRNNYDLVLTESGQLYTVDNGSNSGLGGNPLDVHGNPTEQAGAGEATNTPNDGGSGDPEPLFLLEEGGYYGHPAPARANQDLAWTVYDDHDNPDLSLPINHVNHLSDLVPDGINIADGFLIDPSKFTGDPNRLRESGTRVERDSPQTNALATLGSSSNGLAEYTGDAFDGALQGALIVTQFNGSVTLLNLSDDGTFLEPLIGPGNDGTLNTADDEVIDPDGIFPLITSQGLPLDVTIGPDGTIWVAEFGPDNINVFAPSDLILPDDPDFDNDGILNVEDPFIRDGTNGASALVFPGQTLLWDFDANQDNNLPGPDGYGGGLTGALIDGVTDFEQFFQEPSTLPNQDTKLDNVKFITAAGGGTTVIEFASNGDPLEASNSGEFLFHTGVTIAPNVETFTVTWRVFNPANHLTGPSQQIGGYIGTGDQSNYLKLVATQDPAGEIQLLLEDNDVIVESAFLHADDLFMVPPDQHIFFELEIDPTAATATPTVSYETGTDIAMVMGAALDLTGTAVLDAIHRNYTVNGQTTGLAVGLFSSNTGQPEANAFQAIFGDIEISATGDTSETVLYRVNAGGPEVAAIDGGPHWSADTTSHASAFLVEAGSNTTGSFPTVEPGGTVSLSTPGLIFDTERWDSPNGAEMRWAFDVPIGLYDVRLFLGNGFGGTNDPGERVFDVAIEGIVPSHLDNIDLISRFGHQVGGMVSHIVEVTDGTLTVEFLHSVENPLINGIEIVQLGGGMDRPPTITTAASVTVPEHQTLVLDINATDANGDTEGNGLAYSLTGGVDQGDFSIDPTTGVLSFITAPDFESPRDDDGDNVYDVEITVTDSAAMTDTQLIRVTVSGVNESSGGATRLEAEAADPIENYRTENIGVASGNQVLSFLGGSSNEVGSATFGFDEAPGVYDIILGTFDENDGQAQFVVELNDLETATTTEIGTIELNANLGSNLADAQTAVSPTVAVGVELTPGDSIMVNGIEDGNEHARLDYIELIPVESTNSVSIATRQNASEPNGNGQFIVSLSEVADTDTVVNYFVTGTAATDDDYAALTGTVTIPAGTLSVPIDVTVIDDQAVEGDETVVVSLDTIIAGDNNLVLGSAPTGTLTIADDDLSTETVLYRVNAGGPEVAAIDGGPNWLADTTDNNSPFLVEAGSNHTTSFLAVEPGGTVLGTTPGLIFDTERWDLPNGTEMQWAFDVSDGFYDVRLFFGNGYDGTRHPGERVFDVAIEGIVPSTLDDIDLSSRFGHQVGGMTSNIGEVTDGTLNIEFLHGLENPLVNGIEIVQLGNGTPITPTLSIVGGPYTVGEGDGQVQISVLSDVTVPSNETVNDTNRETEGVAPSNASYIGVGGTAGYEGIQLLFDETVDGGFEPGATLGFSIEMALNSVAGAEKGLLDAGTNEMGSATFGFKEAAGVYDIVVGTFDQNDGQAQFVVDLHGVETDTTTEIGTIDLNADLGSALLNTQTAVSPTVAFGIDLPPDNSIIVNGIENGNEFARIDYIEFSSN